MLERLYVKNVALIDEASVEFDEKLNVLSGETGSGKSVILDSINFVLGSKADKSMIRYGSEEAVVKAEFSISEQSAAFSVLDELDVESDGTLIISRKLTKEGKSSTKINGCTVTASMLKKVASHLVDVHGQSEHFFLLNESNQLALIDSLCGEEASKLKGELASLIAEKRECKNRIAELGGDERERAQKLDLLSYQINEIESADLKSGELDELRTKKKLLDNSEKIIGALNAVRSIFVEDNGCVDMLSSALRYASVFSEMGKEYEDLYKRLDNLSVDAEDISETISSFAEDFSYDEAEARRIDERIALIKGLIKKYGASEELVKEFLEKAKEKYNLLIDANNEIEKLSVKSEAIDDDIFETCRKLTAVRKACCEKFTQNVVNQLKTLNISHAQFEVEFSHYDRDSANLNSANGADEICFEFSANKGEPLKPLNKIISGGEMSRFMLSVKTCLKGINGISTYVFDEIDSGISGVTANTVAEKFVGISNETQIIAVSHLPQVCAAATSQYLIYKTVEGDKTVTKIKKLNGEERVEEIIRLIGGIATDAARIHAEELLKKYNNR